MDENPGPQGYEFEDAQVRTLNTRALLAFCVVVVCLGITAAAVWIIPLAYDKRNLAHSRDHLQEALQA